MHAVQLELQDLKSRLDTSASERFSDEQQVLVTKVESLKEEFRDLLADLRRKKSAQGTAIMSDDVSMKVLVKFNTQRHAVIKFLIL